MASPTAHLRSRLRRALGRQTNRERNAELIERGLLSVGRYSYEHPRVRIDPPPDVSPQSLPLVSIGSFCSIGPEVEILCHGHRTDWVTTFPLRIRLGLAPGAVDGSRTTAPVSIGSDVWIGMRSIVLPGVSIGHGAVVAAGSVVTSDVRPYAVVGGVPAREIRRRFSDETVDRLLAVAWWDWPMARIRQGIAQLSDDDIDAFLAWASEPDPPPG
ncbi:MAG: CatB-related O-acetyltransferase [Acidimicrobiia bacterium]|nr:CatB-related O-acetyltransferase [Acidimicrobiia bacterium]